MKHHTLQTNDTIELNEDIWSKIFIFFDDFPLIEINDYQFSDKHHYINNTKNILSIERFVIDVALVCKTFKKVIDSEYMLLKWQNIFLYNLGYQLGLTGIDKLYDIHVNLLRSIVIINHLIIRKRDYMSEKFTNCYYERIYSGYEGITFIMFRKYKFYREIPSHVIKYNEEYKKNVKDMKKYLKIFKESIKIREDKCNKK